jgi:hypothetical protein
MINDNIKITGNVWINLFDETGAIKDTREIKNLVVTTGKNFIASRMVGVTSNIMGYIELGAGTTAAAAGDTALQAAISGSRTALTSGTNVNNVVTYSVIFPAGVGTGAVTEAGVFNAASAGIMLCRTVFAVVNKGTSDAMSVTWTITVS